MPVGKLGNRGVHRCLVHLGYEDMKEDEYVASIVAKLEKFTGTRIMRRTKSQRNCVRVRTDYPQSKQGKCNTSKIHHRLTISVSSEEE